MFVIYLSRTLARFAPALSVASEFPDAISNFLAPSAMLVFPIPGPIIINVLFCEFTIAIDELQTEST